MTDAPGRCEECEREKALGHDTAEGTDRVRLRPMFAGGPGWMFGPAEDQVPVSVRTGRFGVPVPPTRIPGAQPSLADYRELEARLAWTIKQRDRMWDKARDLGNALSYWIDLTTQWRDKWEGRCGELNTMSQRVSKLVNQHDQDTMIISSLRKAHEKAKKDGRDVSDLRDQIDGLKKALARRTVSLTQCREGRKIRAQFRTDE